MTDYEQFLLNKDAIQEHLEYALMKTLSTMTIEEIKQIPWFNIELWQEPSTLEEKRNA